MPIIMVPVYHWKSSKFDNLRQIERNDVLDCFQYAVMHVEKKDLSATRRPGKQEVGIGLHSCSGDLSTSFYSKRLYSQDQAHMLLEVRSFRNPTAQMISLREFSHISRAGYRESNSLRPQVPVLMYAPIYDFPKPLLNAAPHPEQQID